MATINPTTTITKPTIATAQAPAKAPMEAITTPTIMAINPAKSKVPPIIQLQSDGIKIWLD